MLRAQRRFAEAISEYEAVLALNRNWVLAIPALAQCKLYTGAIEETIPLIVTSPADNSALLNIMRSGE